MKKITTFFSLFILFHSIAFSQFDGAVGTSGCKAISCSDSRIQAWATGCQIIRGYLDIADPTLGKASYGTVQQAIGATTGSSIDAVSLGDGGIAILTFDRPVINGPGYDFVIFENSFDDYFLELAFVEVSSDGVNYVRFPATSNTQTTTQVHGYGQLDPTKLNNLAGKYKVGWGTPFDLDELANSSTLDINNIRFVKIIDVTGTIDPQYASRDAQGNIINDPYPTDNASGGFDLTGVAILNGGTPYHITDFTNLISNTDQTYMGINDEITSGIFTFLHGEYDGFTLSTWSNDSVGSYANQYSAITRGGMNGIATPFLNGYFSEWNASNGENNATILFNDGKKHTVLGMYVTTSTWSYFDLLLGSAGYTTPFAEGDYFILTAKGYDENGNVTGSADFYLADFRSANQEEHYIVKDWRWMDLEHLGEVNKIEFTMSSSQVGALGIGNATYFCLDQITATGEFGSNITEMTKPDIKIYPNPCTEYIMLEDVEGGLISLYTTFGQKVNEYVSDSFTSQMNLQHLSSGIYIVQVEKNGTKRNAKIVKK